MQHILLNTFYFTDNTRMVQ